MVQLTICMQRACFISLRVMHVMHVMRVMRAMFTMRAMRITYVMYAMVWIHNNMFGMAHCAERQDGLVVGPKEGVVLRVQATRLPHDDHSRCAGLQCESRACSKGPAS